MLTDNGCAARAAHSECLSGTRLAGVLSAAKPMIEPDTPEPDATEPRPGSLCDAGFFRAHPAELLDLVATGKTVEILVDLARGADPIAVLMPWRHYEELASMRARIAAITGQMQRSA